MLVLRDRSRFGLILVTSSLCSTALHAQDAKHPTSIVLMTPVPKDQALEQAASGLVAAGYVVENSNPFALTTSKRTFKNVWDLTIRVNGVGAGDSSKIVVSGSYAVPTLHIENQAVEGGHGGVQGKMWDELSTAADSIRIALSRNR
jgi:hypothetical protein